MHLATDSATENSLAHMIIRHRGHHHLEYIVHGSVLLISPSCQRWSVELNQASISPKASQLTLCKHQKVFAHWYIPPWHVFPRPFQSQYQNAQLCYRRNPDDGMDFMIKLDGGFGYAGWLDEFWRSFCGCLRRDSRDEAFTFLRRP